MVFWIFGFIELEITNAKEKNHGNTSLNTQDIKVENVFIKKNGTIMYDCSSLQENHD